MKYWRRHWWMRTDSHRARWFRRFFRGCLNYGQHETWRHA